MVLMKSLLVLFSYHHMNTKKIAEVFARVLDAKIITPHETNLDELKEYNLIGFGAGIGMDFRCGFIKCTSVC